MALVRQGVRILGKKGKWIEKDSDLLIAVERTGYYNFWIDGTQYFYDERIDTSHITNHVIIYAFNGGKSGEKKRKKKGKITITKK